MKDADYKEALDYIDRVSPDLLVIAWPCTKWSRLQDPWREVSLAIGSASYCEEKTEEVTEIHEGCGNPTEEEEEAGVGRESRDLTGMEGTFD